MGFDHSRDPTNGEKTRFRSGGAFLEGDVAVGANAATFLRLDYFDPSASAASNGQRAATVGAVLHDEWLYATPELQYKLTSRDTAGDRRDAVLVLRVAAIY